MRKKQLRKALFMMSNDIEILIKVNNELFGIENYSYTVDEQGHTYLILNAKQSTDLRK